MQANILKKKIIINIYIRTDVGNYFENPMKPIMSEKIEDHFKSIESLTITHNGLFYMIYNGV